MNMMRLQILYVVFLTLPININADDSALLRYNCSGSTNNSALNRATPTYLYNLYNVLGTLNSKSSKVAYYNSSFGETPNRVYGFYICLLNLNAQSCSACINDAKDDILKVCPYQTDAMVWYENCMMRYSRHLFFSKMDVRPMLLITNTQNISKNHVDQFAKGIFKAMDDLAYLTANDSIPGRKFQMRMVNISGLWSLYQYALCMPDLTIEDCIICLTTAIQTMTISIGARVMTPSCVVRYEQYAFYNSSDQIIKTYPFFNTSSSVNHPPGSPRTTNGKERKRRLSTRVAVIVPVVVAIIVFLSGACICFYHYNRTKPPPGMEEIIGVESLQFDFKTIKEATNNFSFRNKVGQGGFGGVYKGKLHNGQEIAVKRLSMNSGQGITEFKTEILLAAKLQHNNLAKLLGFCLHSYEKLLIYEFVPNASLDKRLFGQTRYPLLDWETRYKILLGTARGLLYLHEDSRLKIIHRDLKSSNILLDESMNPKISDFGLARLVAQDQNHADTSKIAGTYGYMAPEYALTGRFSIMSDVYSFGVITLEESLCLRAWNLWKGNASLDMVDPRLEGNFSRDDMKRCIHMGLLCIQEDASKRPTMATIVSALNGHQVALSEPEAPLVGPSANITYEFHQNEPFIATSTGKFSNDDDITEIHPR